MVVQRIEKHMLKSTSKYYSMLAEFANKSNNLYNHANFIVRQSFIESGKWTRYQELDKLLKNDKKFDDYHAMPTAQSAQQTLRLLDKNWKSFFASIKDWAANKDKYLGRPKLPKYKSKGGKYIVVLTSQEARLRNGVIHFPKSFKGLTIAPHFIKDKNFVSFQQVRFIPSYKSFAIELVYSIKVPDTLLPDNGRYLSIDIGLDNLATVVNNVGNKPIVINGKGLKSINKYYNKQVSHYRKIAKRMNSRYYTNRMNSLTLKRNHKIDDYMHKASKYLIDYAIENNFNTIVVGNNKGWKQKSPMGKKVNQSFVGIPHMKFIQMIQYKAQNVGLNVILTEESYTSGTSFLDNEEPIKINYDKNRRVQRGLFVSNSGIKINADVNGAYQIMRKVFCNAEMPADIGFVFNPAVVAV